MPGKAFGMFLKGTKETTFFLSPYGNDLNSNVTTDAQWHQFVGLYDNDSLKIYIDGVFREMKEVTIDTSFSPIAIGREVQSGRLPFRGTLDDIRIYNRALSEAEVKQLYNLEKPSSAAPGIPPESARLAYRQQLLERFKDDIESIKPLKTLKEFQKPLSQLAADAYVLLNDPTLTPAARYETYHMVSKWARQAADSDLFFQVVEQWAKEFEELNATLLRAEAIEEWAELPMEKETRSRFLVTVIRQAQQADQESRWPEAARFYRIGVRQFDRLLQDARRDRNSDLIAALVADKNRLQAKLSSLDPLLAALEAISKNPGDTEAQLTVAFHLVQKRNDWSAAIPYFTRGSNERLRTAAQLELAGNTTTTQQIAIADQWYDVAQQHNDPTQETGRHALLRRARYWYRRSLDRAVGADKLRISRQLENIPLLLTPRQPSTLTRGLVVYYPFQGSGHDVSGNKNHLTTTPNPARDRFGIDEGAIQAGAGNIISATVKALPTANTYRTLSLWTNQKADNSTHGLAAWGTSSTGEAFSLVVHPKLEGDFFLSAWGSTNDIDSQFVADGQWHHLVAVYDGTLRIYVDGRLRGKDQRNINTSATLLYIGSQVRGIQSADGAIDDVRVYNRAFTATEVKTLYTFEKP